MEVLRVLHVANMNYESGIAHFLMSYYRKMDKSRIQFDFLVNFVIPDGNFISEIEHMGGRVFILPYYKRNFLGYCLGIDKVMRRGNYQVIHAHEFLLSLVSLSIATFRKIPIRIMHSHNASIEGIFKNILVRVFHICPGLWSNCFCSCSRKAAIFLFGKKIGNRALILHNAIDTESFIYSADKRMELRKQLSLDNDFVVGTVGRLSLQKNHTFLLDVFHELLKLEPKSRLLLMGEGELYGELFAKTQAMNLERNVLFLGYRKDIPDLLQVMDLFALPSFYEGLPIAVIEAQASGLPCVVSDKITHEADITGKVSFLSLNSSPGLWAQCMFKMRNVRKDARQSVISAGYDIGTQSALLEQFYINLVKK